MNVFCKMQRPFAVAAEGLGTSEAPEHPKHPKRIITYREFNIKLYN